MKYRYCIQKMLGFGLTALLATACTDTWNDHYSVNTDIASNSDKTLWQVIQENDSLAEFAALLEKSGYNTLLTQDRFFTVWAPVGDFAYSEEDAELLEKEFVQNHIANYRHVGVGTLDERNGVKMLNGKRLHFTGSTGNYYFNNVKVIETNIPAKNGVIHLIEDYSKFSPNIWEYLEKNPKLAKFNAYLKEHTDSTINHTLSEVGGSSINDFGQVVYADTVWKVTNVWWNRIGQFNNEDSAYTVIAPTDEAWDKMYAKVASYLRFDSVQVSKEKEGSPDSLQDLMVKEYICRHLAFSQSVNPITEISAMDSLISTYQMAYNSVVFRDTECDSLFANQVEDPVELSNGIVHIVDQLNYSPLTCWLDTIKMEAENTSYCYEFNNKDELGYDDVVYQVASINRDSAYYETVSGGLYMLAEERVTRDNGMVEITYTLPDAYAAKYRIKVVVVPAIYQNAEYIDKKPAPINMIFIYPNGNGSKSQYNSIEYKNDAYDYQRVDTLTFKDSATGNDFVTIPYCEFGLTNPSTQLKIQMQHKRNSRGLDHTLRIDRIIMEPVE